MNVTCADIIVGGLAIICGIAFIVYFIWVNKDDNDGDGFPQC